MFCWFLESVSVYPSPKNTSKNETPTSTTGNTPKTPTKSEKATKVSTQSGEKALKENKSAGQTPRSQWDKSKIYIPKGL